MAVDEKDPAGLLRQAADRLDELSKAAPPAPWRQYGEHIAAYIDECTCGSPLTPGIGHEPGCGLEQFGEMTPEAVALTCAVRGAVPPLAEFLRSAAREWDEAWKRQDACAPFDALLFIVGRAIISAVTA